jgi:hypothetical protein
MKILVKNVGKIEADTASNFQFMLKVEFLEF